MGFQLGAARGQLSDQNGVITERFRYDEGRSGPKKSEVRCERHA